MLRATPMSPQTEHFEADSHIINYFPEHNRSQQIDSPFRRRTIDVFIKFHAPALSIEQVTFPETKTQKHDKSIC